MGSERQIKWHLKNKRLIQVPNNGIEYAFVSEDYRQIHQLVWCKDFLQDAVFGQVNQKPVRIFGFLYDPETDLPIYMEKTRIMITNWRDANFGSKIHSCLEFLNEIEAHLKMSKTTVEKCAGAPQNYYKKSGVWLLEGSKRWMKSPPMISLYTLLIRIGMVHKLGGDFKTTLKLIKSGALKPYNWYEDEYEDGDWIHYDNDRDFLKRGNRGLSVILKHGDRKVFYRNIKENYPARNSDGNPFLVEILHDWYGFVGFSKKDTKDEFPYWHRLDRKRA